MSRCKQLVAIRDLLKVNKILAERLFSPVNCGITVNQLLWLIRKLCMLD